MHDIKESHDKKWAREILVPILDVCFSTPGVRAIISFCGFEFFWVAKKLLRMPHSIGKLQITMTKYSAIATPIMRK